MARCVTVLCDACEKEIDTNKTYYEVTRWNPDIIFKDFQACSKACAIRLIQEGK